MEYITKAATLKGSSDLLLEKWNTVFSKLDQLEAQFEKVSPTSKSGSNDDESPNSTETESTSNWAIENLDAPTKSELTKVSGILWDSENSSEPQDIMGCTINDSSKIAQHALLHIEPDQQKSRYTDLTSSQLQSRSPLKELNPIHNRIQSPETNSKFCREKNCGLNENNKNRLLVNTISMYNNQNSSTVHSVTTSNLDSKLPTLDWNLHQYKPMTTNKLSDELPNPSSSGRDHNMQCATPEEFNKKEKIHENFVLPDSTNWNLLDSPFNSKIEVTSLVREESDIIPPDSICNYQHELEEQEIRRTELKVTNESTALRTSREVIAPKVSNISKSIEVDNRHIVRDTARSDNVQSEDRTESQTGNELVYQPENQLGNQSEDFQTTNAIVITHGNELDLSSNSEDSLNCEIVLSDNCKESNTTSCYHLIETQSQLPQLCLTNEFTQNLEDHLSLDGNTNDNKYTNANIMQKFENESTFVSTIEIFAPSLRIEEKDSLLDEDPRHISLTLSTESKVTEVSTELFTDRSDDEDIEVNIPQVFTVKNVKCKKSDIPPLETLLEKEDPLSVIRAKDLIYEPNMLKLLNYAVGRAIGINMITPEDYSMIEDNLWKEMQSSVQIQKNYKQQIEVGPHEDCGHTTSSDDESIPLNMHDKFAAIFHERCISKYPYYCTEIIAHSKFSRLLLRRIIDKPQYVNILFKVIADPYSGEDQILRFNEIFTAALSMSQAIGTSIYEKAISMLPNLTEKVQRFGKILQLIFTQTIGSKTSQSLELLKNAFFSLMDRIESLNPEYEEDANEAEAIIEILRSLIQIRITPPSRRSESNIDLSLSLFESKEFASKIFGYLFSCENLLCTFEICANCIENYIIYTPHICILANSLSGLKILLEKRASNSRIDLIQLSICNIIHAFITRMLSEKDPMAVEGISNAIIESSLMELSLDLFFRFPLANILHNQVCQIFGLLVLCNSNILLHLVKSYRLMNRLVNAIHNRGTYSIMYGPLFKLFDIIVEEGKSISDQDFELYCSSVRGFKQTLKRAQERYYTESLFELGKGMRLPKEDEVLEEDESTDEDETSEEITDEEETDEETSDDSD